MPFVDGHVLSGSIDLGRRGQYHALDRTAVAAGVQHVRRADDVGLNHVVGVQIRVRNCDQGSQMEDPRLARHGLAHCLRIFEVASVHLDLGLNVRRQIAEMASVVATIVAHQGPDPVTLASELLGQVTADEPSCSSDQYGPAHGLRTSLRLSFLTTGWPFAAARRADRTDSFRRGPTRRSYGFSRT